MTHRIRSILFLLFAVFFVIAAPSVVFYSLGWRVDFVNRRIIKTGAMYFKVWPKSADIYLNGKLKKKTDFFFGSALVENLIPRKYSVEVKKDGYQTWKKDLEVQENIATEEKNIILVPSHTVFNMLAQGIEKYFFSPDEKEIILMEKGKNSAPDWILEILDTDKNIKSHLIDGGKLSKSETELANLKFSPDSRTILLEIIAKATGKASYFVLDLQSPSSFSPLNFLTSGAEDIYFNPADPGKMFWLKSGNLNEIDITNGKSSPLALKNIVSFLTINNNTYYLDKSGFLFKDNPSFSQPEKLNTTPLALGGKEGYEIIAAGGKVFVRKDNNLYKLNLQTKKFDLISDSSKGQKISSDLRKVVYFNDNEIWVLFIEENLGQPRKEAGEKTFITRFSEKIDEVYWLTDDYLVFNSGNKIKIAEIDDRDRINIFDVGENNKPDIFWSRISNKLYYSSENNLYVSEKLAP